MTCKFIFTDPLTTATNNLSLVKHLSFVAINSHVQSIIPSWSGITGMAHDGQWSTLDIFVFKTSV